MRRAREILVVPVLAFSLVAAGCELPLSPRDVPFGFTRASARDQRRLEDRFQSLADRTRIRDAHRELTRLPHPAGSPRDRELADWIAREFTAAGMQDVQVVTHDVLLPRPIEISVETTHPRRWRAPMHEEPTDDRDTHIDPAAIVPHHAYSASSDVEAMAVYAGYGMERDYDWLRANGIDPAGKIVVVRHSTPYSYRGFKAYLAERRGAAGMLMYSDPADDNNAAGTGRPPQRVLESRIQRGSIAYDFLVPGDPLTPGWPSLPGARRVARSAAVSLPKIASVPISAHDARPILEQLEGPVAPKAWHGNLPVPYRVGPGPLRVRLNVRMDEAVRPIWTVTGMFRGAEFPDEIIILGNHRDAWVYGGVDPSSGSAALLELARAFGVLARQGWRPKRSILFASWDGEEHALTSSTEWGEQHATWLRDRAVAYLNVDSAASGARFVAGAVPSLVRLLSGVAESVRDPVQGIPVATVSRDRARMPGGTSAGAADVHVIDDRLGGGSDYAVFLNFLGIPAADLAFDGPNYVYHSLYDTHEYVSRVADPGFRYHAALVQVWGLATLRLAQADAVPLDPKASAMRITEHVRRAQHRIAGIPGAPSLARLTVAAAGLESAAASFDHARGLALEARDMSTLAAINAQVIRFERAFVDEAGLRGRPWYRHVVLAPRFTYEPQELPGLHAAIEARDLDGIAAAAEQIAQALQRAAAALGGW